MRRQKRWGLLVFPRPQLADDLKFPELSSRIPGHFAQVQHVLGGTDCRHSSRAGAFGDGHGDVLARATLWSLRKYS